MIFKEIGNRKNVEVICHYLIKIKYSAKDSPRFWGELDFNGLGNQ
jgi:hypothetical protein